MARGLLSFDIVCRNALVNPNNNSSVIVTIDDAEKKDVLDLFDSQEMIDHIGVAEILDQIGEDEVRKHFNIE